MARKFRTAREKKELGNKIAEIIWTSLASAVFLGGIVFMVLGAIIDSISGNFKKSPLYFLIEAQDNFFAWVNTWWSGYSLKSFSLTGLVVMLIGLVFLLIVLLVSSNRQDAVSKKDRARKLREQNVRRFEAQLEAEPSATETEN
mgnify:FL=1